LSPKCGYYIAFVMLSYTCVGENILSHILFIFTLLCSCSYWCCLPLRNKGNALPEKSNLKPVSSENNDFLFFPVLLSLYSTKKCTLTVNFKIPFVSCSSLELMQSYYQLLSLSYLFISVLLI